jgi:transposase
MARSYRPVVRDQEFLLPPNMADWLPPEHLVWFVIGVIDRMDTDRFHRLARRGGVGRQGYSPDMLLTLLVYAYACGERSSRRIERLCTDHVAFRVACGDDAPDHTRIARFRAEHQDEFAEVFAQVLRLCAGEGMGKFGTIAIDGTKIAANASRGANRSPDTVREQARRIAEDILAEATATDLAEDAAAAGRGGGHDDDLPPGFADHSKRAANIKRALEELDRQDAEHAAEDAADAERAAELIRRIEAGETAPGRVPSGVDPVDYHRARLGREQRRYTDLDGVAGHRASRARSEAKRAMRRAEDALTEAEQRAAAGRQDRRGRAARKREAREQRARRRGGPGRVVNTTDPDSRLMTEGSGGGYVQGYNVQFGVTDDHLIVGVHVSQDANDTNCYAPTLASVTAQAEMLDQDIGLVLADAGYFTEENLTSPGPDRLIAPGKNHAVAADADATPTLGPPPPGLDPLDTMRHLLRDPANAEKYKRRGALSEPVNAHAKDRIGLRRFARRGLTAVTSEATLVAAAVNLNRLHTAGSTG